MLKQAQEQVNSILSHRQQQQVHTVSIKAIALSVQPLAVLVLQWVAEAWAVAVKQVAGLVVCLNVVQKDWHKEKSWQKS
jgi:uncharacterized membrane-anchored protein